jgi:hypothetical protein
MNNAQNTSVTGNRVTYVTLGDYIGSTVQPWIAVSRNADEMCRTQQSQTNNVVHLPHIGKTIRPYHLSSGDATWLSIAQPGELSVANGATIPPNHNVINTFSQQTISGVTYNSGVQSVGTAMNIHQPPAGTNWSSDNLTADQNAFPSPNTSEDVTPMLRVLLTTQGMQTPDNNLSFNVLIPSASITPRGSIANFYFQGPAGDPTNPNSYTTSNTGSGRYSLKIRGDKYAYLYELAQDNATWIPRFSFLWDNQTQPTAWTMLSINIVKRMWKDTNGNWVGDTITFNQSASAASGSQLSSVSSMNELSSTTQRYQKGLTPCYKVPRLTNQHLTLCPVRMDLSIDCRGTYNACKHVYMATGSIVDDLITFDQPIVAGNKITAVWSGTLNNATGWTPTLKDQNGNSCTASGYSGQTFNNNGVTSYQQFTPTAGMSGARFGVGFEASSDTFSAPVLQDYKLYAQPIYQTTSPITPITVPNRAGSPALWQQVVESVNIHPQESDPGAENATIVINDLTGELDSMLEYVNMTPIHVWCTDPDLVSNPNQVQVSLFRGYILIAQGKRMRTAPGQIYPNEFWTQWTCQCVGEWSVVQDATLPRRQIWQNEQSSTNSLVTDCVNNMLLNCFPQSMVNVPSSSIQLFGTDPSTWTSEPGTRVSDLTQNWMQDYFGGWCGFDESCGTQGVMRGFFQKFPPYNNLAIFEMSHPTELAGDNAPRIPQWIGSYPVTTAASGQVIRHTFMQADTFEPHTERAEANCVIVFGGGVGDDAQEATGSDATMFSQFAINVNSYNFLNLSPTQNGYPNGTNPAYFGRVIPIRVFRYDLPNQAAVDWYCRRIFDRTCYARYFISFTAPLLFVNDITDTLQVRPRRLRYYDAVQVRQYNGSLAQFLVVSCSPSYTKDGIQMANYTLVTQQNINQRAVIPYNKSQLQALKKAGSRTHGADMSQSQGTVSFNKQGVHINNDMMALPAATSSPLQDLNNNSTTFGQFYQINDYSPTGEDLIR